MFFYLSKFFSLLFLPYPFFLILFFILSFRLPSMPLRLYLILSLSALLLLSLPPLSRLLLSPLESAYPRLALQEVPKADALVVLAGMIHSPKMEGEELEFNGAVDRILTAEALFALNKATYIVLSGSSSLLLQEGVPEALALKEWLQKRKVPPSRILAETGSRNTAESARALAQKAKKRGWRKILLLTSAYHMPRSMACFRKARLKSIPIPVDYQTWGSLPWPEAIFPSLKALALSTLALREYLGLLAYKISGQI